MDGKFIAFSFISLLASVTNAAKILIGNEEKEPVLENSLRERDLNREDRAILRFVVDFAIRAKWEEILVIVPVSSGVLHPYLTDIYEYLAIRGIFISVHSTWNKLLPGSFAHVKHRLGIVVLWGPEMDSFFDEGPVKDAFDEYRSWLFVCRDESIGTNATQKLEELGFGLGSNAVISRLEQVAVPTKAPKSTTKTTTTTAEPDDLRYYEIGDKICVPENENEYWYRGICITGSALPLRIKRDAGNPSGNDPETVFSINQIYKIPGWESDLVQINLGYWDPANGLNNVREMVPIERRLNFHPFRIIIGIKNATLEGGPLPPKNLLMEREEFEEMRINEVLDCLLHGLNASREVQTFAKLGWRNEEGGWTHMLGAVVEGNLDIALDTLNVKMDPSQDLLFTNPIVKTMNNIYFRRPESGGMRDIFLAPFSSNLLASVFGINFLLALAMISIAIFTYNLSRKNENLISVKEIKDDTDKKKWEASDAFLWSVSVMCMQGSSWHPISTSGSLLLISGLLFALVIYNAYAAFITSVLSVKTVRIKTLQDLLLSDFAFGYTLGKDDELYLRTVNDSLLRELYFKGLRENDGVNDPITGMLRAGMGEYAFFVAAPIARKALRREVPYKQRCGIQELILPRTETVAAIPMSRSSPLKKVINYRLLRMMESGILRRFQSTILLPMPRCVERTKFNSARFADVYSAFYMIVSGWILSLLLLFGEILYHKRKMAGKVHSGPKHSIHLTLPHLPHFDFHWPRRMHN